MDEEPKKIKQDINFLEYPNWVLDKKAKLTSWSIEKGQGKYEMACINGLPNHFDKLVLYFLLYKLNSDFSVNKLEMTTSRYEIGKNVFEGVEKLGQNKFDRIMESLRKWKGLTINFEGIFYEGSGYTERYFSVIDDVILDRAKRQLYIRFNQQYISQLNESTFYKFIDFEQYKKLSRALSARLYEILIKTFKERDCWNISLQSLAEKLTLEKRKGAQRYYPSDVLAQLKPGIAEINKKTELVINFEYDKKRELCAFKKLVAKFKPAKKIEPEKERSQESLQARVEYENEIERCMSYFDALAEDKKSEIMDGIRHDPFIRFVPEQPAQILAYLKAHDLWQAEL